MPSALISAPLSTPASVPALQALVLDDPLETDRFTRAVAGPEAQIWAESSLALGGMHCAACSGIIEQALLRTPGVRSAQVSAAAERATVVWDPRATKASALIAAVQGAGYDAVPDAAAPARALRQQAQRSALWRLFVAGFCAMQVMMLATPSYVAGPGELSQEMGQLLNWGGWMLSLPVLAFSATPFFQGAWRGLMQRRIGMDLPVALGILITFIASSGATFNPGGVFGSEVYFDSLTMFVSFLLGARWIELLSRRRAAEELERSLARLPETAWRVDAQGEATAVSTMRLLVGDTVRVPLGQAFPADGVVLQGQTEADESLLSGESTPLPKAPGDAVAAGSLNLGAPVLVRVERVGGDTRLERIVELMHSAFMQRPAAARVADRWAGPFLWTVLLLAALGAAAWSVIDPSRAVWVAVSVLIVTCPCALSMAAPATLVAAARGLARRGVLLQRLDALEALALADHFVFDKTGTLTEDAPQWRASLPTAAGVNRWGEANAAACALATGASLAVWSSHPLSRSLAQHHQVEVNQADLAWHDIQEHPGSGLSALDAQDRTWRLGRADWVQPGRAMVSDARLWLGCEGVALAGFEFDERLRPGAHEALAALRAQGVQLSLMSGDSPERVRALAQRLGVQDLVAAATPQDKLAAVARLQSQGQRVVMVGDGVNDAPVLARADMSLAMGQGALVSRSRADAVIISNRLLDLVLARRSAQRAMAIVRQNFIWAGAYNALCIPLALVGWLPPWAAGAGMALSSLLVVLNAQRAAR